MSDEAMSVKVEIRSVNHRYGDIQPRLPRGYQAVEDRVRRVAAEYVRRGRVEIYVSLEEFRGKDRTVRLDQGLLEGYLKAFSEVRRVAEIDGGLTLEMLAALPDLLVVEEKAIDVDAAWPKIEQALRKAFEELTAMRRTEGAELEADILHRLSAVEQIIARMSARAPEVVREYQKRLAARVEELVGDIRLDEERLAQEVAIFADKSNIDEELTRAKSHLMQFRDACGQGDGVGRKLDFLLQELNREINTVASKSNDSELSEYVVQAKAELEKIREQVQNVE